MAERALSNGDGGPALSGRRRESLALDRLLESVRAGASRVLVLRGERGIGKSALLEYLTGRSVGIRVARAAGVESEMALPYSGLHQVCAPALDLRECLPAPQRDALASAFGLSEKPIPAPLFVGLAVLGLLCEVASDAPLLCIVDDAQWLDGASALTLAFVARRVSAAPVGFVFAVDEPCERGEFSGLPELVIGGMSEPDACDLLDSLVPARLDETVRDRIVSESRGNPLTLHELAWGTLPGKFAGGFAVPDPASPANSLDEAAVRRLRSLPVETRRMLLLAAAEPLGDASLLRRAAACVGLGPEAAVPAQAAGLIDIAARVRFSHPELRAIVYRGASLPERRAAHRALAEATDRGVDPDRVAWHRAQATDGLDEEVAAELELSASRAAARGGVAAAGAFLARATDLTPDPGRRAPRALAAAERKVQAGEFDEAASLLATAGAAALDDVHRARVDLTRARLMLARGGASMACPPLLTTARTLESLDAGLAREAHLEAFAAAMLDGRAASGASPLEVAHHGDVHLDAAAARLTDGYAPAAPLARRVMETVRNGDDRDLRRAWLRSAMAADLWDDERWDTYSASYVKLAREGGVLSELPLALDSRAFLHLFVGELAEAARLVNEAQRVSEATGTDLALHGALALAAWRGREGETTRLIEEARSEVAVTHWARALLSNALGRYEDALAAAAEAAKSQRQLSTSNWGLVELIEAAARCGETALAAKSLDRLSEMAGASGSDWALGVEARSDAQLSEGDIADRLYRQAIERLGHTRVRPELARAHLLYGEWLRREHRRVDAREQLRTAHEMFVAIGMDAFAERARGELQATGEKARKRTVETRDDLTDQELQIARLASDGLSNPEIGARLFLSPRTVEWHLYKVFAKLDIRSRRELASALLGSESELAPA